MTKPRNHNSAARRSNTPVTVPLAATPAGETPTIDQWAHRVVWTDRMLATLLANKVKGGKWHTLIDKVFPQRLPRTRRWPNAYFTQHGYIGLSETHARFVQSIGTY